MQTKSYFSRKIYVCLILAAVAFSFVVISNRVAISENGNLKRNRVLRAQIATVSEISNRDEHQAEVFEGPTESQFKLMEALEKRDLETLKTLVAEEPDIIKTPFTNPLNLLEKITAAHHLARHPYIDNDEATRFRYTGML